MMKIRTLGTLSSGFLLSVILMALPVASAGTPFYDDFEDGSATDGSPVSWGLGTAPFDNGEREVIDGSYVLTPDVNVPIPGISDYSENDSDVIGWTAQDFSLRTTVRALGNQNNSIAGLYGRDTWDGSLGLSVWMALFRDGEVRLTAARNGGNAQQATTNTNLDIFAEDVNLRMDVYGRTATAFAWRAGEAAPVDPLLTIRLPSDFLIEGKLGIWNGQLGTRGSGVADPIAFRHIEVVPEPSAASLLAIPLLTLLLSGRRRRRA